MTNAKERECTSWFGELKQAVVVFSSPVRPCIRELSDAI